MKEDKLQGIVLKAVPFKDRQSIVTLLSYQRGLVSVIVKGIGKARPQLLACINPLAEAEFLYTEGRSDLLKCQEASLIDPHLALRDKYIYLDTGLQLAKALLSTQYPAKPSTGLYTLFSRSLKQIPSFKDNTDTLKSCFMIKLLKHEGLLPTETTCSLCQRETEIFYHEEGIFCREHHPYGSIAFTQNEWAAVRQLADVKGFSLIQELSISSALTEKIELALEKNSVNAASPKGEGFLRDSPGHPFRAPKYL